MGSYTLWKSHKKYVNHISEIPQEVKDFFETYEMMYIDSEDELEEYFEEDPEAFKVVKEFYDKNELYGWDLEVGYD